MELSNKHNFLGSPLLSFIFYNLNFFVKIRNQCNIVPVITEQVAIINSKSNLLPNLSENLETQHI